MSYINSTTDKSISSPIPDPVCCCNGAIDEDKSSVCSKDVSKDDSSSISSMNQSIYSSSTKSKHFVHVSMEQPFDYKEFCKIVNRCTNNINENCKQGHDYFNPCITKVTKVFTVDNPYAFHISINSNKRIDCFMHLLHNEMMKEYPLITMRICKVDQPKDDSISSLRSFGRPKQDFNNQIIIGSMNISSINNKLESCLTIMS